MEATVKITPRVAAQVARRLRLAASVCSRSMPAMVNDALDETLPSLEEIRMRLASPAAGETGRQVAADIAAGHAWPAAVSGVLAAPGPGGGAGDGEAG